MKNFASFFSTFLLHTLVEMLENCHFSKMKFFLSKNCEIVSFLVTLGAHSRARRPLHDRLFQPPFFWNLLFERFPELDCSKVEVPKIRIKGVPLWFLFFFNHFLGIFRSVCYKKPDFQKSVIFEIPGTENPGYRKSRISQITDF